MSCSLISWKTFAIEYKNNINPLIKCNLCKNNIIKCCIDCEKINSRYINCPIVKGDCNNFFHKDCIDNWNKINKFCPQCEKIHSWSKVV